LLGKKWEAMARELGKYWEAIARQKGKDRAEESALDIAQTSCHQRDTLC
jgi:hypothetical protein